MCDPEAIKCGREAIYQFTFDKKTADVNCYNSTHYKLNHLIWWDGGVLSICAYFLFVNHFPARKVWNAWTPFWTWYFCKMFPIGYVFSDDFPLCMLKIWSCSMLEPGAPSHWCSDRTWPLIGSLLSSRYQTLLCTLSYPSFQVLLCTTPQQHVIVMRMRT